MFEARLEQSQLLKKLFEAIKELCKDVRFDCNENGIALQAMDSSHVALVAMLLKESAFNLYRCDRNVSLGVNIESVVRIFKTCGNDDIVTIKKEEDSDTLLFSFENPQQERYSAFELKLIDIDCEHLGIPDTVYKCVAKMPSLELQKICRDLKEFGETVQIGVTDKDGITFSVNGDIGNGSVRLKRREHTDKESERVELTVEEPVTLAFALRYLNFFTKATPLAETVTMHISRDYPLIVDYELNDSQEKGYLRFYLAPKIDE
jgi:proliferating cell nuclear antigen